MRCVTSLLAVFLLAGNALAGTVWGIVETYEAKSAESSYLDKCFWRLGRIEKLATDVSPPVVLLEDKLGKSTKPSGDSTVWMYIEGYEFSQTMIPISTETTLVFKNRDIHPYSCIAKGPNSFQFSELKPGDTHEQRLLSEGLVKLRCHKYPFMQSNILVVSSSLVTTVDSQGRFSFQKVPAGEYRVKVFTAGSWSISRDVSVTEQGIVKLALGPGDVATSERPAVTPQPEPPPVKEAPKVEDKPPPAAKPPAVPEPLPEEKKPIVEKKPPVVKKPPSEKKPPVEKKPPKKKPPEEKKPPKKKPPAEKADEPTFKDVEPEIEIEED